MLRTAKCSEKTKASPEKIDGQEYVFKYARCPIKCPTSTKHNGSLHEVMIAPTKSTSHACIDSCTHVSLTIPVNDIILLKRAPNRTGFSGNYTH